MKLGCCIGMNAADEAKIGYGKIPLLAKLGYDYVELPLAQVMAVSDGAFTDLLKEIRDGGIPAEACNNFFPGTLRLTGPEARSAEALEYAKRALERAAQMGVRIVVFGSAGAKNIPPGFPYDAARAQLAELLRQIQPLAAAADIIIAMEPLNSKESNFITTAAEGLALVRELGLPNVKLLVDYYHLRLEKEDPKVIASMGTDLRHLHIAAQEGRHSPLPNDGDDYGEFFDQVKAIGYTGRLSIEGFTDDLAGEGARSLSLLRSLC